MIGSKIGTATPPPVALSFRRQLVLESDALEFLTEMLDPIFGLLALNRRHESCNTVRTARRDLACGLSDSSNDGPDFELVRHRKPTTSELGSAVCVRSDQKYSQKLRVSTAEARTAAKATRNAVTTSWIMPQS